MKISLGSLVLCAGFGRHAATASLVAPGRMMGKLDIGPAQVNIQRAEGLRAVSPTYYPRGNASQEVKFKVEWQFVDFKTAVTFRGAHPGRVLFTQGNWMIQPEWPGDGISQTLYHPGAILISAFPPAAEAANAGVSVVMDYTLAGGLLTTVNPAG